MSLKARPVDTLVYSSLLPPSASIEPPASLGSNNLFRFVSQPVSIEKPSDQWTIEVFFDGDCPLCLREINLLKRLDRRNKIVFTNIVAADFVAEDYGKTMSGLMSEIHGRLPGGEWIVGVEVFRQLYKSVGFGPLVSITRLPVLSHLLQFCYKVFAENRLRLTGRCNEETCGTTL